MPQTNRTSLGFNVGNEFNLDLVIGNKVLPELGLIESIAQKVNCTLLEMTPTNNFGYVVRRTTFQGYTVDLHVTRQDDTMDDLVDYLVAAYHTKAPIVLASGVRTVISNGLASQWKYINGTLVPGSLGTAKGSDRTDDMELSIHFTDRQKVRGASAFDLSSLTTAGL